MLLINSTFTNDIPDFGTNHILYHILHNSKNIACHITEILLVVIIEILLVLTLKSYLCSCKTLLTIFSDLANSFHL